MSPANIEAAIKSGSPLIGQACCIGDSRPYNTALIVLDADFAPQWASQHGLDGRAVGEAPEPLDRLASVAGRLPQQGEARRQPNLQLLAQGRRQLGHLGRLASLLDGAPELAGAVWRLARNERDHVVRGQVEATGHATIMPTILHGAALQWERNPRR